MTVSARQILGIQLQGAITWRLPLQGCPRYIELAGFPGFGLISPLERPQLGGEKLSLLGPLADGTYIFSRNDLWVFTESAPPMGKEQIAGTELWQTLERLLRTIRFVAKQYTLPRRVLALTGPCVDAEESPAEYEILDPDNTFMQDYIIGTAVGLPQLSAVASLASAQGIPLWGEVVLDALEARVEFDHKRAILFAGIAMEAAVADRLEQEYASLLAMEGHPERLRIVDRIQPGGKVVREDPIFKALRSGTLRAGGFKTLVHELSLYLLNRSLLVDDEPLYARAKRLYATRNQLAHGSEPDGMDLLSLDLVGSREALEAAIAVMRWFDHEERYVVWKDFINVVDSRMSWSATGDRLT
jgi:hypothetical protein